jgi:hypothetical protein
MDMRLDNTPADVRADVYALALRILPNMNQDVIIADHPTGTMTVEVILHMSAQPVLPWRTKYPDNMAFRSQDHHLTSSLFGDSVVLPPGMGSHARATGRHNGDSDRTTNLGAG